MSNVFFIFAHQDDEYFAAPWIRKELRAGSAVRCIYLTNGNSRRAPDVRDRESTAALGSLGVQPSCIRFAGTMYGIADGGLVRDLEKAHAAAEDWCREQDFSATRIYAPDFEGGHQDHDAAHVVAVAMSAQHGILNDSWSFTLYNAYGCPRPLFRTLRPLLRAGAHSTRYSVGDGLRFSLLCRMYRSQARTWLGLFPESFVRRVFVRREWVNRLDERRILQRPHEGTLLYEWMFGASYAEFEQCARTFLHRSLTV